jgi:hypothetical protein
MKKITSSLLFLTLLLCACSSSDSSPVTESSAPVEATDSGNGQQIETSREAVLSEIENDVSIQFDSSSEFVSAELNMVIPINGTIQTGDDSRAKLNLIPENTIVRVGPNSSFTLSQIEKENGEPKTTLQLLFGKVFILLNGGSLEAQTPSGVASVRGSLLSVQYNPDTNRMRASCLEGQCALKNKAGDEIEFTEGESVFIDESGLLSDIEAIDQDEILDWLEENPELIEFMDELPNPEDFPDFENDEWNLNTNEEAAGTDENTNDNTEGSDE